MITDEIWSLDKKGSTLAIKQFSRSFCGEREIRIIFDKR